MRGIVRVVVVMVFISLAAYGLRLLTYKPAKPAAHPNLVPPRLAAQQAAHASSAGGTDVSLMTGRLIYPGPAAQHALHLGYSPFDLRKDGSIMVVPLPPGSAWQTMLALNPAGHHQLVLRPMSTNPPCNFAVSIVAFRVGQASPVWHGRLPAHSPSAQQVVDLSGINAENPLLVSLRMADDAKNNWSCNVMLSWDDAAKAHP